MVTRDLAASKRLWALGPAHVALWCAILPWLDRDGRHSAEPHEVRGNCCPYGPWTVEQIEAMLFDFTKLPDFQLYEEGTGHRVMQFDHFSKHQAGYERGGANYEREPESVYPGPNDEGCHPVTRTATRDLERAFEATAEEDPF